MSVIKSAVAVADPRLVAEVPAEAPREITDRKGAQRLDDVPHERVADDVEAADVLDDVAHALAEEPLEAAAGDDERGTRGRASRGADRGCELGGGALAQRTRGDRDTVKEAPTARGCPGSSCCERGLSGGGIYTFCRLDAPRRHFEGVVRCLRSRRRRRLGHAG